MINVKATIAYKGTHFYGWQKTAMGPSIEGEIEKALLQILQVDTPLQAASRTDRGVHAMGQVINFHAPKLFPLKKLEASLRRLLPKSITLISLEEAYSAFHPTLEAKKKEYRYSFCSGPIQLPHREEFSWHVPQSLSRDAMHSAIPSLLGTHDFSAFSQETYLDPIRTLESIEIRDSEIIIIGKSFLYKMARAIAGTLIDIGRGRITHSIPTILTSKDRRLAGVTAPAHGLTLHRIFY